MTTNLHEVLNANPQSIEAATKLLTLLTAVMAASPWVAGILFIAIGIGVYFNKKSAAANKVSSDAAEALKPLIEAHKKELAETQATLNQVVKDFSKTVGSAKDDLIIEISKVKIGVAKVNNATNEKLGMIPKVQDAISDLQAKQNNTDYNFKLIIEGIKKRKGDKNGN